jgi:hypothetical protein
MHQGGYRSLISYVQCDFTINEQDSQMCCLQIFPQSHWERYGMCKIAGPQELPGFCRLRCLQIYIYDYVCIIYALRFQRPLKKTTVNVTPFRILDFEGFQIWTMCGHKQWSLEPQAHHCQPWIAKGVGILCVHCHHLQRRNRSFTENRSSKRDGQLGWSRTPTLGFGHDWKMNALFARKTAGN